jgi:hypothetical protein
MCHKNADALPVKITAGSPEDSVTRPTSKTIHTMPDGIAREMVTGRRTAYSDSGDFAGHTESTGQGA